MAADAAIRVLLDKEEIRSVLLRYCRGVDRSDEELIRSAFHPDAVDDHGPFKGPASEFAPWALDVLQKNSATTHFVGNQSIEVDGDAAWSEAYLVAVHRFERDGAEYEWVLGGRYVDYFERRDGEWRIARRITVHDWNRVNAVLETFPPADLFVQGRRTREDPSYRRTNSGSGT